jgi:hypothetical protein
MFTEIKYGSCKVYAGADSIMLFGGDIWGAKLYVIEVAGLFDSK